MEQEHYSSKNSYGYIKDSLIEGLRERGNTGNVLTFDNLAEGHQTLVEQGNHIVYNLLINSTDFSHKNSLDSIQSKLLLSKSRKRNHCKMVKKDSDDSNFALARAALVALNDGFGALKDDARSALAESKKSNDATTIDLSHFYSAQIRANALLEAASRTLFLCLHKDKDRSSVLNRINIVLDSLEKNGCSRIDFRDKIEISYLNLPRLSFDITLGTATFQNCISQASTFEMTKSPCLSFSDPNSDEPDFTKTLTIRAITTVFENDAWSIERKHFGCSVQLNKFIPPKTPEDDCVIVLSLRADNRISYRLEDAEQCLVVRHVRMVQTNVFPHKSHEAKELYTSLTRGKNEVKLSVKFPSRSFTRCNPSNMLIEVLL